MKIKILNKIKKKWEKRLFLKYKIKALNIYRDYWELENFRKKKKGNNRKTPKKAYKKRLLKRSKSGKFLYKTYIY